MPLIILSILGSTLSNFDCTTVVISQADPGLKILFTIVTLVICIAGGIIGITLNVKLLNLPVSLYGMLKPYVCISIIATICFMLFFLGPIGAILSAVTNFMLGIILLKTPEKLEVEFV